MADLPPLRNSGINDDDVEKALDYLRDTAETCAETRAARVYLEEYRKSLKAILMKDHTDLAVNAQEREAYAHPDYVKHLAAMRVAVFEDEKGRFLRHAAEAKIEAWRTQESTRRSMKL